MFHRHPIAPLALIGALATTATAQQAPVIAGFDQDLEGFTAVGFEANFDFFSLLSGNVLTQTDNSADLTFDAGGDTDPAFTGNPGGFARFTDVLEDPASFLAASGAFTGDLTGFLGGSFSFDHRLFNEGDNASSIAPYAVLFVSGDVNDLNAYGALIPGPQLGDSDTGFVNVSVDLLEGGPSGLTAVTDLDLGVFTPALAGSTASGLSQGLLSTALTLGEVFADVTDVFIAFELVDNNSTQLTESAGIDNVVLAPVPEPTTLAVAGLGACALLGRRRHASAHAADQGSA